MPAMRRIWVVIGAAGLSVLIVLGLPVLGVPALASPGLRLWLVAGCLAVIAATAGFGFWRDRARADALEAGLLQGYAGQADPSGEARLLSLRMADVLRRLKRKGGRGYLYARPWYVIIGPPGVGKTTALQHCGVPFETLGHGAQAQRGLGGTRNVDWWFTDAAVLLDTAGRYVTHEADRAQDVAGWGALLRLLRTHRPRQPVNGVMLAFSAEDLLFGTPDGIAWHAATVRARLAEIREVLSIDVPVYVLFTKVDLVAGFRERFRRLSPQDRQAIWGHTFQTQNPGDDTVARVGQAFDGLLGRLSTGTVTEIAQDHDGASRIAGFAFPTQMALLKPKVESFLAGVFAAGVSGTRHRAILRGFYFTSGTQEGTPFDQILGMLARDRGDDAPRDGVNAQRGKSYFLHDLLTRVVFAERDWVGHDARRSMRLRRLRRVGIGAVGTVTGTVMLGMGVTYWSSATRVAEAEAAAAAYFATARESLGQAVIDDPDPRLVLALLDELRAVQVPPPPAERRWPGFGLDRHPSIAAATTRAYADGLERLLRPRLMLSMENMLLQDRAAGPAHPDPGAVFQRLLAYLHLSRHPDSRGDGDAALRMVFTRHWRAVGMGADEVSSLLDHLHAMGTLDDAGSVGVSADAALVADVRAMLTDLPLSAQVLALQDVLSFAEGIADLAVADRIAGAADLFRTIDGQPLGAVFVPGLFTDAGARRMLARAPGDAAEVWRAGRWVLDGDGVPASVVSQLATLDADVDRAYRRAAARAWDAVFQGLALRAVTVDGDGMARLAHLGDPARAPFRQLARMAAEAPVETLDAARWRDFGATGADAATAAFGALGLSLQAVVARPTAAADVALAADLARLSALAEGAPDALARMVAATVAGLRQPDPKAAVANLRRAFDAEIVAPCRAELENRFPFAARGDAVAVPMAAFGAHFGQGGRVETFIADHLAGHVIATAGGLRPDAGGPLAPWLEPGMLEHLDRARAIRDAFFMDQADTPSVPFALELEAAPPEVAQVVVTLEGATVILRPEATGSPAVPLVWTGASDGLSIQLADAQGQWIGDIGSGGDGWDVPRWLGAGRPDDDGATTRVRTDIAGRIVAFRATFDRVPVPFGMAALRDWTCPGASE